MSQGERSIWVKSGHWPRRKACPLSPQKQTLAGDSRMSAKCQKQTHAVQQKPSLDHLVGKREKQGRGSVAEAQALVDLQPVRLDWGRPSCNFIDNKLGEVLRRPALGRDTCNPDAI